jgi:SAM-dependent methyltransferase
MDGESHHRPQTASAASAAGAVGPACPVCQATPCRHFTQVQTRHYWRCTRCQATFLDPGQWPGPLAEQAEYRLHRNDIADPRYRQFLSRLAGPLLQRLPPGLSGLDYGCGPAPALAAMLTEAGHRMALYDPLFFDDPGVLDSRYDFITCTEVAEHFRAAHAEFTRLNRLLRPGGCLAVMTRFQTDDAAFAGWHYRRDPTHLVFYREATFRAIASQQGWHCEIPCANVVLMRKPPTCSPEPKRP